MSKARLVITAVIVEGRSQADVARTYEVSPGWVSKLVARYRVEGESAFELRSRTAEDLAQRGGGDGGRPDRRTAHHVGGGRP